ncbi:MAG: hypothetical protein H7837_13070 [Magnetococcus sp. MYC-9]
MRDISSVGWLVCWIGWLACLLPAPCHALEERRAGVEQGTARTLYRECLLNKVQPALSTVAATQLQQVCRRKFAPDGEVRPGRKGNLVAPLPEEPRMEQEQQERFDDCLLEYLPTVHNDQSANAMLHLCQEQFGAPGDTTTSARTPNKLLQWLGIRSDKPGRQPADLTLEGETFVPLVPWQGGQPH